MLGKYYNEYTEKEAEKGIDSMRKELVGLNYTHPIRNLFEQAVSDFRFGKFSFDGATFVKERFVTTKFEVGAFIHDWRNSIGYVGKKIDEELFSIMIVLKYPVKFYFWRLFLTNFTFLNVLRHKAINTYKGSHPRDLFIIHS